MIRIAKFVIIAGIFLAQMLFAEEQSLDLDSVSDLKQPLAAKAEVSKQKFSLMGRVDLTSETTAADKEKDRTHTLDNRHFMIFLKVEASEKTSFLGEFVNQSFYYVDYKIDKKVSAQFGKIPVSFGDTRKFHRIYGGVAQLRSSGVMFPNVWAESGLNFKFHNADNSSSADIYWIDSIQDDSAVSDPSVKSNTEPRSLQAGGARWTQGFGGGNKWTGILSGYRGEFQPGKEVILGGLDIYSDYGALPAQNLRIAIGFANAWFKRAPVSGDFQQKGDFIELALANGFRPEDEARLRYGTYIHNDQKVSQKDIHSFALGYAFALDVMRMLVEYQWNFEAIDETNNDVAKAMISLDF